MKVLIVTRNFGEGYNNAGVEDAAWQLKQTIQKFYDANYDTNNLVEIASVSREDELIEEVNRRQFDCVFIEGVWVSTKSIKKLNELCRNVTVRIHSQWSFTDPGAMAAIQEYIKYDTYIIINDWDTFASFSDLVDKYGKTENYSIPTYTYFLYNTIDRILYLPNTFEIDASSLNYYVNFYSIKNKGEFHVGMFGELRVLKNHFMQAVAVRKFSKFLWDKHGVRTYLHVNTSFDTDPVLGNIRALTHDKYGKDKIFNVVESLWLRGGEFDEKLKTMNLGLQVSFTETFNLTGARFVKNGVPVIGSQAIEWLPDNMKVPSHSPQHLYYRMREIYSWRGFLRERYSNSLKNLIRYDRNAEKLWFVYLGYIADSIR